MKWVLKRFIYLVMFGGVLFIPLVIFSGGSPDRSDSTDGNGIIGSIGSWFEEAGNSISSFFSSDQSEPETIEDFAMTTPDPDGQSPHLDGGVFSGIEEILRFKISPQEITNRWARVTFHIQTDGLHSYRVPVVTGESSDDLAGALTYLFDQHKKLQRIEFHGSTQDTSTLIDIMKQKFRMTKRPSPLEALYVKSQYKLPVSALRIVRPPLTSTTTESPTFEVRFELNRLYPGATLSDSFRKLIDSDRTGSRI